MPERGIRAVFFDLDGTLADTAPDLGGALNELLIEVGRAPMDTAVLRPHVSAGTRGMLGIGFGLKPDDADYPDLAKRFLELYAARICVGTRLFDGMAELLDALERRDILWGVVTNKPARFTEPLIDCLGLTERSAAIISGDSAPKPKPAPDTLLLACEQAGVPPRLTFYVGDDLRDVQAAHAAGMRAIAAAWGYLGDGVPIADWNADATIAAPLNLLDIL
ncbi:MAG: HAD-IA family hydrolase [Gammaproteobacteria bacterium]|nr:HAD-IA family hydrolase [Gammaproteobacteria bacterium]MBU1415566.1 HAD-IA family hydrolase [Gammaproteobacteria bacterium]